MGVIKQGILGGFSGKVAGVVGSSWKGIAVIKAKPLSVANPKTAAQTGNRTSFKAAALTGSELLTQIVKPLWDRDAQRQSGYNAFVSNNKAAFSTAGVLDVTEFVPTLGKLPATEISVLDLTAGGTRVSIEWVDDSGEGEKKATDVCYAVAYNATTDEWAQSDGTVTRDNEGISIDFKTNMSVDDVVSAWLLFADHDKVIKFKAGSDLSNTVQ